MLFLASISALLLLQETFVGLANAEGPVPDGCVRCICNAMSLCDLDAGCESDVCGPFKITKNYWVDANTPTINNEDPSADNAYPNCANNYNCAKQTLQSYMKLYEKDCNGDGVIDCLDHAAIHKFGPGGCGSNNNPGFLENIQKCWMRVTAICA